MSLNFLPDASEQLENQKGMLDSIYFDGTNILASSRLIINEVATTCTDTMIGCITFDVPYKIVR